MIGCSTKEMCAAPVSLLLEPGEPIAVRGDAGHDIVQAVSVHVVDANLVAAAAEVFGMEGPGLIASRSSGVPTSRKERADPCGRRH